MSVATNIRHLVGKAKRLGFFARLSNIIIIQMLFVFAAVALLLFFPQSQNAVDSDLTELQRKIKTFAAHIDSVLTEENLQNWEELAQNRRARAWLDSLFQSEESFIEAEIIVPAEGKGYAPLLTFQKAAASSEEHPLEHELSQVLDTGIVKLGLQQPSSMFISSICCAHHMIHYYPFPSHVDTPGVLVALSEHNLVISDRAQLKYALFILFLFSTLVSLLTVYLISNRFKEPLNHLIQGFEKTADGELYYLFESSGDVELQKLVNAFNRMSETLWRNHKRVKEFNYRLAHANQELIEAQVFLATLIDRSPSCIITTDAHGKIMIFNRMATEVFGYANEEMLGRHVDELFTNAPEEKLTEDTTAGIEVLCQRREGTTFPAYLIVSPIIIQQGHPSAYLYIVRDISESKSYQEMMIRIDRYYTRGEMAGEVAHEINNYLAVLSGNIELLPLMWKKGDEEKFYKRLEVMKQTVDKIARFSDGLMNADPDETKFELTDLNQLVENTVAFLKPQNKFDTISVTTSLSPDMPPMEVDIGQLQQLVVNLLYNSAEALANYEGEKRITVTTTVAGEAPAREVRIIVADTGPGVEPDKEPLLFDKRFTTKRKGHGIGLISCRKIVEAHGGTITYHNDNGAVFTVSLPVRRKSSQDNTTSAPRETTAANPA